MQKTRVLVLMGLFIAINVILSRFVTPIDLPYVRVSFGFIATAFSSILLGPILGGLSAAIADILGFFLKPSTGSFFPGFTVSALLAGIFYGLFLHKKPESLLRTVLAVISITLIIDLGLNTYWLSILYKKAWVILLGQRIVKSAIMLPIQVTLIHLLWRYTGSQICKVFR